MIVVLHPAEKAKGTVSSMEFEVPDSQSIPAIGDTVSMDDPFIPYAFTSRHFLYSDNSLHKVMLGVEA